MKTPNQKTQKQRSPFAKIRVLYIEYPTWKMNEHFISAVVKDEKFRQHVIARIYMQRNQETKRMEYIAKDSEGKQVFASDNLFQLKQQVKENARELLQMHEQSLDQPTVKSQEKTPEKKQPQQKQAFAQQQTVAEREEALEELREKNQERAQEKGLSR
jgi:hypothetical protein